MRWTDSLDAIYIINLPKRSDRRNQIVAQMKQYDLPYSIWPAIENENNGALGLMQTMKNIFEVALKNKFDNIWLIEDDCVFLQDINDIMPKVIDQLPADYHLLYLGINAANPFAGYYSENLLKVTRGLSTHSIIYSKEAMELILSLCNNTPIDVEIAKYINPLGKCYATFPLICGQQDGWSDIENRNVSYKYFLEERYEQKIKAIQ